LFTIFTFKINTYLENPLYSFLTYSIHEINQITRITGKLSDKVPIPPKYWQ
jgi:hypothetical protein